MFECVVWFVRMCCHVPYSCLSLSFRVWICRPLTIAVSECDGSIKLVNILVRGEWQWKCERFQLQHILRQTRCGIVDLGPHSMNCDLQEVLIYVLCQEDCVACHLFLSIHERETSLFSLLTSYIWWRTTEATYECVCVSASVCVCACMCIANWWSLHVIRFVRSFCVSNMKLFRMSSSIAQHCHACHRNVLGCAWTRWIGSRKMVNCTVARFCVVASWWGKWTVARKIFICPICERDVIALEIWTNKY